MRAAIRVVAGLFAVLWALPGFGLIDLEVTIAPDAEWRRVALLDGGWGLFVTAFIVAGLVLVTLRPVWASEIAAQLGGVAALIAVSAVIAGEFTVWWMLLALALPAGMLAGLAALGRRRGVPVMAERPTPVTYWAGWSYFGLTVLAGTFWLDYAVDMFRANRDGRPPAEITNDVNHWAIQAAFALALVGFSVLATARATLRRFNAVRVGLCAAYFGLCSLRFPDAAAALSTTGAALAIAWGVALVAVSAGDRWPAARSRQG